MRRAVAAGVMTMLALVGSTTEVSGAERQPGTVVTFTFDDGFLSQLQAADVLADHGMAGTFYVNSGQLGWEGYMEPRQLRHLVNDGHEIAGHALSHDSLTELTAKEVEREVCGDRAALAQLGFHAGNFAYPYGAGSPAVARIVRGCGYNSARDVGGLSGGPHDCSECPAAEDLPPTDRLWNIRTHSAVHQGPGGLETVKGYVTRAEAVGGWVPLVFHRICDGCAEESMSIDDFTELVEWLEARAPTTRVKTVAQVVGGPLRPVVGEAPEQIGGLPAFGTRAAPPTPGSAEATVPSSPGASVQPAPPSGPREPGRTLNNAVAFTVGGVGIGQIQVVAISLSIALVLITGYRLKTRRQRHEG